MKFPTIVMDPPWLYEEKYKMGRGRKHKGTADNQKFPCMSMEELRGLRASVLSVAEPACHLYMWCTNSFVEEAYQLTRHYGFTPRNLLSWIKPYFGTGNYFRVSTEHLVFSVRGSQPILNHGTATHFFADKQPRLAAKPDQLYQIAEKCSPGPYLDVFARRERAGWTSVGNEIDGEDVRAALRRIAAR